MAANIGVLAGILFLALEIRQNTQTLRIDTYESRANGLIEMYADVSQSPVLSSALTKLEYDLNDECPDTTLAANLTDEERLNVSLWFRANAVRLDAQVFQYEEGSLDAGYFSTRTLGAIDRLIPWLEIYQPNMAIGMREILVNYPFQSRMC